MSVLNQKWVLRNNSKEKDFVEKVLINRGLQDAAAMQAFLEIEDHLHFHDPYLLKDMQKAVDRISKAIANQEKIIIFGDYDVDGITGSAILVKVLERLGAQVSYRIPNRLKDGYGLNPNFIDEFIKIGLDLLITVDCGISCPEEVTKAKQHGIDVIITDHHTVPENPPLAADAIVHPLQSDCSYPFKGLTGSAVAFKLACALTQSLLPKVMADEVNESLLDLATLGTVADCGPLVDENRLIVRKGLKVLAKTKWKGLRQLMSNSGIGEDDELDASSIGYRIAPRINASGRISNPLYALQLLLNDSDEIKIEKLAQKLEEINRERQVLLEEALKQAREMIDWESEAIIIAHHPDWHVGILGLIAGRINSESGKPAMIMQDQGERLVGSARSNEFFNVVDALTRHSEYLENFGGHHQAAGFDLPKAKLQDFVSKMRKFASENLASEDLIPSLEIDSEIELADINWDAYKKLARVGPFGNANEEPKFLLPKISPVEMRQVGADKRHLSLKIKTPAGELINAIGFKMGEFYESLSKRKLLDMVVRLNCNRWNGKEYLQLIIEDIAA